MTFSGQISEKETISASKIIKTLLEEILLLHLILYVLLSVCDRASQCILGWPHTSDSSASASGVLCLQACAITPSFEPNICK